MKSFQLQPITEEINVGSAVKLPEPGLRLRKEEKTKQKTHNRKCISA